MYVVRTHPHPQPRISKRQHRHHYEYHFKANIIVQLEPSSYLIVRLCFFFFCTQIYKYPICVTSISFPLLSEFRNRSKVLAFNRKEQNRIIENGCRSSHHSSSYTLQIGQVQPFTQVYLYPLQSSFLFFFCLFFK